MGDSIVSATASDDYSRIGFEKTLSIHFEDLKRDQASIRDGVTKVRKDFAGLKKRTAEFEKNRPHVEGESGWTTQEVLDYEEEMALAAEKQEFSQRRQDLIGFLRIWAQDSADQLVLFPGFNIEARKKRAVDFINLMKRFIASTTPLGEYEVEDEADKEWLARKETSLPAARDDAKSIKDRLRSSHKEKRVNSPAVAPPSFINAETSTPELIRESKKSGKTDEPRSNLAEIGGGFEAQDAATENDSIDGCEKIRMEGINPNHVCEVPKDPQEKKDDTLEESGPPYERPVPAEDKEKQGKKERQDVVPKKEKGEAAATAPKTSGTEKSGVEGRKEEEDDERGRMHLSIIRNKLNRSLMKGVTKDPVYSEYQRALEDLQKRKTLADRAEQKSREKEQEIREEMQKAEEEIQAIREVMVEVDYLREKEAKREAAAKERAIQLQQWQAGQRWAMADRKAEMEEERRKAMQRAGLKNDGTKPEKKATNAEDEADSRKNESASKDTGKMEKPTGTSDKGLQTSSDLRRASSSSDDEWKSAKSKAKAKKLRKEKRRKSSDSDTSEESSTTTDSSSSTTSSEGEKKGKTKKMTKKSLRQFRHETMVRQRMNEARPKTESEKFGGDSKVNYLNFKQRFHAVTKVGGANKLDVLNELVQWLRDGPKKLADAHIGSTNPRQALKEIWKQLDRYYDSQIQTAAERIKPLISKGKIEKDDVDAMIDLQSELLAIQTQCRNSKMEDELDRQDIVRDIVMKRLPFMSDEFYRSETKRQKKDPRFRMKFDDLLEAIEDRARTLKAQGVSSKKENAKTANVAATTTEKWSDKAASPPQKQTPASGCFNCHSLQHSLHSG